MNWKLDAKRGREGLDQSAISYIAGIGLDGTAGQGGGGGRGTQSGRGRGRCGGVRGNWICHLCGEPNHLHLDLPKKQAVSEFLKLHSYAQVKEGTEDTSDDVSDISESTGLGDMAKDMIDKLSRYNPQKSITMLKTMILEESAETPSLTNED